MILKTAFVVWLVCAGMVVGATFDINGAALIWLLTRIYSSLGFG